VINEYKVNLADIKVQSVGTDCLILVTKFSRILKAKHGVVLHIQEPKVLSKIASYAASSGSAQLKIINDLIQVEVAKHLQKKTDMKYQSIVFQHKPISRDFANNPKKM